MAFIIKLPIFLLVLVCSVHCYVGSEESISSEEISNDKNYYKNKSETPHVHRRSGNFESGNLVYGNLKSVNEKMEINDYNSGEVHGKHKEGTTQKHCSAQKNNMILKKSNETKIRVIETPESFEDVEDKSPETVEVHLEPQTDKPEHSQLLLHSTEDVVSPMQNYTFAVSIQKKHSHYANGVLVAPTWVLTTAEEFFTVRESIKLYRARLGSVDCKHGGVLVAIQSIQIHPRYKRGEPNYDIALLKLPYPVQKSKYVKPIAISKVTGHITSAKFLTTYWPRLIVKGRVLADKAKERLKAHNLRVSTQKLIAHPQCKDKMAQLNVSLGSSTLCLKPITTHHSPCLPDAGAPIIANDELWGITSGWTWLNCTQKPQVTPTLFTRLRMRSVMSWLNNFLKNK